MEREPVPGTSRARARSCGRRRNRSEWRVNVTQVANAQGRAVDATDAAQLSAGELEGRRQVIEYLRFLRAEVPGFERAELIDVGTQLGVRETRRVRGACTSSAAPTCSAARASTTRSASTRGRSSAIAPGRVEWQFPRDERNTFNQLPWRMLVPHGGRQSAGGRPLRVDGARGPVGGARQRGVLRDGPGGRHRCGVAGRGTLCRRGCG